MLTFTKRGGIVRALLRPLGTACCLLFAATAAPTTPAAAEEDFAICRDATGDEAIAACDRAIADYDQSISLDPSNYRAFQQSR